MATKRDIGSCHTTVGPIHLGCTSIYIVYCIPFKIDSFEGSGMYIQCTYTCLDSCLMYTQERSVVKFLW